MWSARKTVAVVALFVVTIGGFVSPARSAPLVSLAPSSTTASIGDVFSINVTTNDIVDLYAFQFSVTFDPTILSAMAVHEGGFLSQAGTTFFVPGAIDNAIGRVDFVANTLLGPISGVSGTGSLALLTFSAVGVGLSQLNFSDLLFLDSLLGDIAIDVAFGQVSVEGQSGSVDEPGQVSLLAIALLAICTTIRRRRTVVGRVGYA